jgi:ABC-2 type transport system ATP-binding protein
MLVGKNLSKSYNNQKVVNNIDLKLRKGEILGLLGPNGAGKSTTIKMLTGQISPESGNIIYKEREYSSLPSKAQTNMGIMPQDIFLWEELDIKENLKFTANLYDMNTKAIEKRIKFLIDKLDLKSQLSILAKNLSGGYKRRLNLAISIIHDPEIIFLDEPTPGIDTKSRRIIMDFINELSKEEGKSILLTDHYLDEAEKLSDYVIIIDKGEIIAEGTVPELKNKYGNGNIINVDLSKEDFSNNQLRNKIIKLLEKEFKKVVTQKQTLTITPNDPIESLRKTIKIIKDNNAQTLNISLKEPTLEDIFLLITGKKVNAKNISNN